MRQNDEFPAGIVWFVGAGPGDPDLLTLKAERLIAKASVIFHDALVGSEILDMVPDHVRLVSVGKRAGRHSKDQRTINEMLVEAAVAHEKVLRLKGGDPGIFGRLQEEMDALETYHITYRICPGITAASAAVASAGRSLTLRGMARKLSFVTAHARAGEELDLDWQTLADPAATLAVYMGKSSAGTVSRQLQNAGLAADTPVLLVENASLPNERQFATSLGLLDLTAQTALSAGPAIMLIGHALAQKSDVRKEMEDTFHIS